MQTILVCGDPVGGGVLKADGGRGADLMGEAEGDSPVPGMWDGSGGGFTNGSLAEPEREGERILLDICSASGDRVQGLSFFLLFRPPRSQSLLIMGWFYSIPEHRL